MDCIAKVQAYVKEQGLDKEIPPGRIVELGRMLRAAGGDALSRAEFAAKLQDLIETDLEQFAAKQQAARAMALAAREQAVRQIEDKTFGTSTWENLRSWLDGSSIKKGDSVRLDVRRMTSFVQGKLASIWARGIEEFKREAQSGVHDKDVLIELDALQKGLPIGSTKNTAAMTIAKSAYALENEIVARKKAVNPFFEPISDYLMKQSHDRVKVAATDKAEWVTDAMKTFGEKSFPELGPNEKVAAFEDIYDRIKSGLFGTVADDTSPNVYRAVTGEGGNILRRMTRQRSLVAAGPEAFYDYNVKYGYGDIDATMTRVLRQAGRDIALLDKFGPNPREMYEGVVARTISRAEPNDQAQIKRNVRTFENTFRNVIGLTDAPAQGLWQRRAQAFEALQYVTKGGGGVLRALPDVQIAASRLRDLNGKTLVQNTAEIMTRLASNMDLSGSASCDALTDLGMAAHTTVGDVLANLGGIQDTPGALMKAADAYGSLTLHKQWVDAMRASVAQIITRQLGRMGDTEWGTLPREWQEGFTSYGIKEQEWNAIRQSPVVDKLLIPESIEQLPDSAVAEFMRSQGRVGATETPDARTLDYERYKLAQKVGTLINDHADYGTVNPNTRQRAFMNQGLSADDPWGAALRLFTQFKGAALVTYDSYRRTYYSGKGLQGNLAGVATSAILGAFMYGIGDYALQLAAGKTPEDPTSPEMVTKLLVGSGVGGIFADVLEQAWQQNGVLGKKGAILSSLAGPAASSIAELGALGVAGLQSGIDGKNAPAAGAGKLLVGQIPAQNLFWTKALFNFYFANGLKEFLGPGYLSNLERHVESKPGLFEDRQRYLFLRPTDSPRWQ